MKNKKRKVVVTMGDPAGVGPEVIAKALTQRAVARAADFIVVGDEDVFARYAPDPATWPDFIHVAETSLKKVHPGRPSAASAYAALAYLQEAVTLVASGRADAMVTAPLSKEAICEHEPGFVGHTEFLADAFGVDQVGMLFVADALKVIIVTRHLPLKEVPGALTTEAVLNAIVLAHEALKLYHFDRDRGSIPATQQPRIAVCGLNPHAGENGLLGEEEQTVIVPAIKQARRKKIRVDGPFPADTLFVPGHLTGSDLVVAMYHDQGLIPIKAMHFNRLVNMTIGLPFVRTSPAHGTAFDIAGQGVANPGSMAAAMRLAATA